MAAYKNNGKMGNRYNLKYDKEKHPDALIEIFAKGDSYAQFCADNSIGERTFFYWVGRHAEFADAYEVAKMKAKAWWEDRGKRGLGQENFGATAWSMVMRNRFGYTEHRRIEIAGFDEAKTPAEKVVLIDKAVASGKLTGSELGYMNGLVDTSVRVLQHTKMEEDIKLIKATLGIRE